MYKCKTTTKYVCNLFFQALVKLFLDLHEKHNVGLINAEVRFEDVTSTIELLVTNLSECSALLELQPQFKRQLDSFDKVKFRLILLRISKTKITYFPRFFGSSRTCCTWRCG